MIAKCSVSRPYAVARSLIRSSSPPFFPRCRGRLEAAATSAPGRRRQLLTLAIETSCDDTCVAVLSKDERTGAAHLHFNKKITSDNREYRGVHPIKAVLSHTASLAPLVQEALESLPEAPSMPKHDADGDADGRAPARARAKAKPDFVTVTRGPGMTSNLATGLNTAKGLAVAWGVPLLGVNHMQAHALTPRLVSALKKGEKEEEKKKKKLVNSNGSSRNNEDNNNNNNKREEKEKEEQEQEEPTPTYPFLSLLVSGGHTLLVLSSSATSHKILAAPLNIAIGDMIDKCARLIVPAEEHDGARRRAEDNVMYGPLLESFAFPDAARNSNSSSTQDYDYDYDYGYEPPARRVDEIQPFTYTYTSPETGTETEPGSGTGSGGSGSWALTPPLAGSRALTFDFSGLNGAVPAVLLARPSMGTAERRVLARETMRLAFEHLGSRLVLALRELEGGGGGEEAARKKRGKKGGGGGGSGSSGSDDNDAAIVDDDVAIDDAAGTPITTVVVAGGVASNRYLMHVLRSMLSARGYGHLEVVSPPLPLCTDNAAMVAWAGVEMWEAGWRSALDVTALRKWPLDPEVEGGILGATGWVKRKDEVEDEKEE
ncbi:hypothetical protein F4778DRAFT_332502 [Xylariomycetidae sp. FL2044]|nr:hypothetical protein F4778DRAFT_332502 [Xylariomycetidae sp. FL2044]